MNFSVGRGNSPGDTAASSTTDDIQDRFARDALEFQDDSMTEDDQSDEGTFPQDPMVEEWRTIPLFSIYKILILLNDIHGY